MKEDVIYQPKLSRESALVEYTKTGLKSDYNEVFWQKYSSLYDKYLKDKWEEGSISDDALCTTIDGMQWYVRYREIGHPEDWCLKAWDYGAYEAGKEYELSDYAYCLLYVYGDRWLEASRSNDNTAVLRVKKELKKHCDFIGLEFGKSSIYCRFFYEWFEDIPGGSIEMLLERLDSMERAYFYAIEKGKSEDFAYYYATEDTPDNWRFAELRDSLLKEGRDEAYVDEYLYRYEVGLLEDGEEREHPDHPTSWEIKVMAYMKAWDYVRNSEINWDYKEKTRFIDIYMNEYLNASSPDHPERIPWDRFEEYVMDRALKRFRGDPVEMEPLDLDELREMEKERKAFENNPWRPLLDVREED